MMWHPGFFHFDRLHTTTNFSISVIADRASLENSDGLIHCKTDRRGKVNDSLAICVCEPEAHKPEMRNKLWLPRAVAVFNSLIIVSLHIKRIIQWRLKDDTFSLCSLWSFYHSSLALFVCVPNFDLAVIQIFNCLGAVSIRKTVLPGMAIPMLKIRRPNGRLIFNMEIAIHR